MTQQIYRLVELGGPVLLVLLGLSVVGVAIALYKLAQLRICSRRRLAALGERLQAGSGAWDGARSPLEHLLADACTQDSLLTEAVHRSAISRRATALVADLGAGLRTLELIAYIAPLLGLLGTVFGMIEAFRGLEAAGAASQSGSLAGGIWEALLTTAAGLSVAIPLAVAQGLLSGRVQDFAVWLEDTLEYSLACRETRDAQDPADPQNRQRPPSPHSPGTPPQSRDSAAAGVPPTPAAGA